MKLPWPEQLIISWVITLDIWTWHWISASTFLSNFSRQKDYPRGIFKMQIPVLSPYRFWLCRFGVGFWSPHSFFVVLRDSHNTLWKTLCAFEPAWKPNLSQMLTVPICLLLLIMFTLFCANINFIKLHAGSKTQWFIFTVFILLCISLWI